MHRMEDNEQHEQWHIQQLSKHCRVCGHRLERGKARSSTYSCKENMEELQLTFGIGMHNSSVVHPSLICGSCYMKTKRKKESVKKGEPYDPDYSLFQWLPHSTPTCSVYRIIIITHKHNNFTQICAHFKSSVAGGRAKRGTKKRGRPSDADRAATVRSVKEVQPPSFYLPGLPPQYCDAPRSLLCCVCMEVLNRPILLPCNELVCGPCYTQWVTVSRGANFPCCYGCEISSQGVRKPPSAVLQMLALICKNCHQPVQAVHYIKHLNSKCGTDIITSSPYELTVREILATPSVTPPTAVETKAASKIIKRLMTHDSTTTIKVPTSGQVHKCQLNLHSAVHTLCIYVATHIDARVKMSCCKF